MRNTLKPLFKPRRIAEHIGRATNPPGAAFGAGEPADALYPGARHDGPGDGPSGALTRIVPQR